MRWRILLIALPLIVVAVAVGQTPPDPPPSPVPDVSVDGPDKAVVGQLVVLRAAVPDGAKCSWTGIALPHPEDFQVDSSSRSSYFSGRLGAEGSYSFVLGVNVTPESAPTLVVHTIVVGEAGPEPGPGPDPPQPDPDLTGWAKWTYDTVIEHVPSDGRLDATKTLVGSMESVLAAVSAGAFDTPKAAREAMGAANRRALKYPEEPWKTWDKEFDARLAAELDSLADADKLTTLEQYRQIWSQIVEGLKQVANSSGKEAASGR